MTANRTTSFYAAVTAILCQHAAAGALNGAFTVRLVEEDKVREANEAFAGDPALMSRYIDFLTECTDSETYVVDSGDAELGTILVLYVSHDVTEVYHT